MASMGKWVKQARCASGEPGIDPKDFQVPLRGNSQNKAKLVCAECPVRKECLRWALENQELWGVWGGLDESEIRKVLSVDSLGQYSRRSRAPGCPNSQCRARPSALEIVPNGKLSTIRCQVCNFEWNSSTSAAAIKAYWKTRRQRERQKKNTRPKTTNARVPQKDTRASGTTVYLGLPASVPRTGLSAAPLAPDEDTCPS